MPDPELTPRERSVLKARCVEHRTRAAIAEEMQTTPWRIRQTEARGLRKLGLSYKNTPEDTEAVRAALDL